MGCNTSQDVKAKKTEDDVATEGGDTTKTPSDNEQTTNKNGGDATSPLSAEDKCTSDAITIVEAVTKEPTERAQNNGIQQHGKQQQKQPPAGDVTIVGDGKHQHNGLVNGDIKDDTSSSNVKRCDKAEISELNNLDIDGDDDDGNNDDKGKNEENDEDDEEKAATKIQAAFRGHKVRATMKKSDDTSAAAAASANKNTPAVTDDKSKAAVSTAPAEVEPTKEELEAEFDPNDKDLCNAALKIQATFRGHLSRKLVGNKEAEDIDIQEITKKVAEELDIDLSDPELNKAATKIQASFRGHKSRKDIPA